MVSNKRPKDWLMVKEVDGYVREVHQRHWSPAYIYGLMNSGKLDFFKFGSQRVILKKSVNKLVKKLKRPAPPIVGTSNN